MAATRASPRPSSGWNRSRRPTPARPTRTSSRLAGVVAIKEANGPIIGWSSGRVDEPVSSVAPDGRLPNAGHGFSRKRRRTICATASSTAWGLTTARSSR